MSPAVTGRLVDENGNAWSGLRAEALIEYLLKPERFRSAVTGNDGRFTLDVPNLTDLTDFEPSFALRAVDGVLRPVSEDKTVVARSDPHDVGDVLVRKADRSGLVVTHLTGSARFTSSDNALKVLIDGEEAFGRVVDELERVQRLAAQTPASKHRVDITQLYFDLPLEFEPDPRKDEPRLIFKFDPPQIVPISPPATPAPRPNDRRPELLLLDLARGANPVKVRVLLNEPSAGWPEGILWLVALPAAAAGLTGLVGVLIAWLLGSGWAVFFPVAIPIAIVLYFVEIALVRQKLAAAGASVGRLQSYYARVSPPPQIVVRGFEQELPLHGVMHSKSVMIDGERAVVLGSPFGQRYFEDARHAIDDPRRGRNKSPPVHDVSVAVVGPAVRHLDETFHLFWNEDATTPDPQPATSPQAQSSGEDGIADVQIVRTLSGRRFDSFAGRSEKGILEAYLRAFAAAQKFIYLETQYFTDHVIVDALEAVLKDSSSNVQVILLLTIEPDVLFYPGRQEKLVAKLRRVAGARLGVFTRWSYDPQGPRPSVAPVYLHTKAGVVDDAWATIGSANLDGLSLDYNLLLSPFVVGETTASEVNVLIFNGRGHNATPVVDLMHRRLWAEHLGVSLTDSRLTGPDPLKLWNDQAKAALQHLNQASTTALPGFVLKYPDRDAGELTTPRKHLKALGVDVTKVRPIGRLRQFEFAKQAWLAQAPEEDLEE